MLAHVQVAVCWFASWGDDVVGTDKSLVADGVSSRLKDRLALGSFELGHVVLVPGDRLGHERDPAGEIGDDQ